MMKKIIFITIPFLLITYHIVRAEINSTNIGEPVHGYDTCAQYASNIYDHWRSKGATPEQAHA